MKLDSFRELLAKKSEDPALGEMVSFLRDDALADMVVESLEKMARAKHRGDTANLAMRDFGVEMDHETEPKMIHDALSHHATQYKAALKAGRDDLANAHAKQIFRTVDMADQTQKHAHGKLDLSAPSPHAWERNAKTKQFAEEDAPVQAGRKKPGQFVTDTKGWRYRGKDYSFLQQPPHESYRGEVRKHGHNQAYPLEQIRVNGKYLHIEDKDPEDVKGFEDHPMDHHPIMQHFEMRGSKRSPEDDEKWHKQKEEYYDSHHMDKFFDKHEKLKEQDPDGYEKRGLTPSSPVHEHVNKNMQPLDLSEGAGKPLKQQASDVKDETKHDDFANQVMQQDIPHHVKDKILRNLKSGRDKD